MSVIFLFRRVLFHDVAGCGDSGLSFRVIERGGSVNHSFAVGDCPGADGYRLIAQKDRTEII